MTSFFTHHGLPVLFAAVAIESFGVPVPGETALIAFGVLASQGHYSIVVVIAVAAAGAIIGDNLGYWLIGRRGGRALLERWPWLERRTERVIPRTEAFIERYGGRAVFFGRFVSVLRETIAWVAGLARMPWGRFLFWNAFGGVVWAAAVGVISYYGGKALADSISRYGLYAAVGIVLAVVLLALRPLLIRRFRSSASRK
jgi:membrane protein DedA with SNARE-associated domain